VKSDNAVQFLGGSACTAVVGVLFEDGLGVDVAGGGELVATFAVGADPVRLVVHGNTKTDEALAMAVAPGPAPESWTTSTTSTAWSAWSAWSAWCAAANSGSCCG
jgi:hypothetical protein